MGKQPNWGISEKRRLELAKETATVVDQKPPEPAYSKLGRPAGEPKAQLIVNLPVAMVTRIKTEAYRLNIPISKLVEGMLTKFIERVDGAESPASLKETSIVKVPSKAPRQY